jgi:hypothetical protein
MMSVIKESFKALTQVTSTLFLVVYEVTSLVPRTRKLNTDSVSAKSQSLDLLVAVASKKQLPPI